MTASAFFDEGSRVLTEPAFRVILDMDLKRAVRTQDFLTLVTLETEREWQGMTFTADDATLREVAQIIGKGIRDTDLIGHFGEGLLAVVLLNCGRQQGLPVIDRIVTRMENYRFLAAMRIAVGSACYPDDAIDANSLRIRATTRPIVKVRGGSASGIDARDPRNQS